MSKIIGIDLGTTNSCVAVVEGRQPKVITNEEGSRTTPSVVAYNNEGDRLVGITARRQSIVNPESTVYSVKRFMGMRFDEAKSEIQKVPYKVVKGKSGDCRIKVGRKQISAPEISAQILIKLKRSAERYLGTTISEAVITVPAYFNDAQRQATKDAGKIAGLEVKRIINEPTAIALAYGLDKKGEQKIAVFDLGGGTFDISILEVSDEVVEVLSTNGDTHLGGDDVDQIIIDWRVDTFKSDSGIDISNDSMVTQRLRESAEKAKIELSSTNQTEVNLPFLTADSTGPKHLTAVLTRSKFEQMIDNFVQKTLGPVKKALKDANLGKGEIDEIIMVGGSTRIPLVRKSIEDFFGKKVNSSVNPDEVVALGAAIQGGVFTGDVTNVLLLDVTPLSLGIETLGSVSTVLISRNTTIPASKSETFSTATDNQSAVDIHVLQGERKFSSDNRTLGRFQLDGLPPAPRGIPQIEVKFDMDANGILSVSAKDKTTGKEQNITIQDGSSLSDDEIKNMISDAEDHEEEDSRKKEIIETRNNLDSLIYNLGKTLDGNGDKVSESRRDSLASTLDQCRDALDSDSIDDLKSALEICQKEASDFAAELYANTNSENSDTVANENEDSSHEENEDSDIIDAEVKQAPM